MLRDQQVGVESDWTYGTASTASSANVARNANATNAASSTSHREIDRALRRIAKVRSGLDADEARWLRRADELAIWPKLGFVHPHEYLEDVFGYAPRTGQERMRVAKDLGALPQLEAALDKGSISWSVARELTRVATSDTEARWLAAADGKNLRQVERLVAGHKKGNDPDDAPDPALEIQTLTLRLRPSTIALLRQVQAVLADERGESLDDDAAFEAMCRRVLDGASDAASCNAPARMIHMTTCRVCQRTTQDGSGARFDLSPAELDMAQCDAVFCDDENGERAVHAIPPVTRRKVMERDQNCCRVPGCRAARNLDVHHIVHRAHGGGNATSNLAVLCSGHHRLLHEGMITVAGNADAELTFTRDGKTLTESGSAIATVAAGTEPPAVAARTRTTTSAIATTATAMAATEMAATSTRSAGMPTASDHPSIASEAAYHDAIVERRTLAKAALQQAGFKAAIAKRAVSVAETRVAAGADLAALIREALRYCN